MSHGMAGDVTLGAQMGAHDFVARGTAAREVGAPTNSSTQSSIDVAILDAARACVEKWGFDKVTMDDICAEAKVSRATVYRQFPGGRDVLFEAMRVREVEEFLTVLRAHVEGAATLEDLIVRAIVVATSELQHDEQLAAMLSAHPGESLGNLTVTGFPRITRASSMFLAPLFERFMSIERAEELVEIIARLVISYFLAPSTRFNLSDENSTRIFVRKYFSAVIKELTE